MEWFQSSARLGFFFFAAVHCCGTEGWGGAVQLQAARCLDSNRLQSRCSAPVRAVQGCSARVQCSRHSAVVQRAVSCCCCGSVSVTGRPPTTTTTVKTLTNLLSFNFFVLATVCSLATTASTLHLFECLSRLWGQHRTNGALL